MSFPDEFWWGSAASAEAVDGPAPASDAFERGAPPALPEGHRPEDDLRGLAGLGLRHALMVLDWSRLEPEPGRPDVEAVEAYTARLHAANEAGIAVWGCLHHGSLPGWFSVDEHGFADRRSREYLWARHVETVGERFGSLVHGWLPVHEPNRWAVRGWIDGRAAPHRRDDAEGFAEALEAVHLAAVAAALRLREGGRPVACGQWLPAVFPARVTPDVPPTPEAEAMASTVDEVHRRSWLRMLTEEVLVVPNRAPVPVPGAREAFDVIGFTYRHAIAVRGDGAVLPYPQELPPGPDGQVAWPEGLGLVLHRLAEDLPDRPLLLAGFGTTTASEDQRATHLRDVLAILDEAVDGGIPLRGAWWDTPIDPAGARPQRGLLDPDRAARPAADLLASVAGGGPVPR